MADLNRAWMIRWVKARISEFIEIANIIIAICLRVDNAIIFFMSCSQLADILEYIAVDLEINSKIVIVKGWGMDRVRNIRNTPAVTSVDEWTSAEIGVGAAIAIGNQAEKGNWALFEQAAVISNINVNKENSEFILNLQFEVTVMSPADINIIISPIRFVRRVIVPDEADEKFW